MISRRLNPQGKDLRREYVWIGTVQTIEEIDSLVDRFKVSTCVIDAQPEIHATREFVKRNRGIAWLCYFNEHQKGSAKWDREQHIVQLNRTEALDSAKQGIRDAQVILPRRIPLIDEFAQHLSSDAKKLIEDEQTGAKSYRYIKTGTNHFSLAFTYDWLACEDERRQYESFILPGPAENYRPIMYDCIRAMENETGIQWPIRWDRHRVF